VGILNYETRIIQNPALGAMLLWRFAAGYMAGSDSRQCPPLQLLFVVLPIILHKETDKMLTSTLRNSGLRAFAGKFSDATNSKTDLLVAIRDRAIRMRPLSLDSIRIAILSSLIFIDPSKGNAIPISLTTPKLGIPDSVRDMLKAAEKLGYWCSRVSLYEVSTILKVGL
jgi:hypothetical protein